MSCEYCDPEYEKDIIKHIGGNGDAYVYIADRNTLRFEAWNNFKTFTLVDWKEINYCPMCGSKLGNSDDYDKPIPANEIRKRISEYCSGCGLLEWLQEETS